MATINLLPWREKQREVKNREFVIQLIIASMLALFLAFAAWTYFNMQLESQNEANELVKQKNVKLDQKLKEIEELEKTRESIISRMKIIQDLKGKRPIQVHVFDELVRTMPKNLYYTSITRKGNNISLNGMADNPNTVSDLLRNFKKSHWLGEAKVRNIANGSKKQIKKKDGSIDSTVAPEAHYISFSVQVKILENKVVEEVESEKKQNSVEPDASKAEDSASNEKA